MRSQGLNECHEKWFDLILDAIAINLENRRIRRRICDRFENRLVSADHRLLEFVAISRRTTSFPWNKKSVERGGDSFRAKCVWVLWRTFYYSDPGILARQCKRNSYLFIIGISSSSMYKLLWGGVRIIRTYI